MTRLCGGNVIEAVFSECGRYRHSLFVQWDKAKPVLPWILFNPSIAGQQGADGETMLDPTARKGRGFSERAGFGGMVFTNLFDFISTDSAGLRAAGYPRHAQCNEFILNACHLGDGRVVCAWGALARGLSRPHDVVELVRGAGFRTHALGLTDDGLPRHPLMLSYKCALSPWEGRV